MQYLAVLAYPEDRDFQLFHLGQGFRVCPCRQVVLRAQVGLEVRLVRTDISYSQHLAVFPLEELYQEDQEFLKVVFSQFQVQKF